MGRRTDGPLNITDLSLAMLRFNGRRVALSGHTADVHRPPAGAAPICYLSPSKSGRPLTGLPIAMFAEVESDRVVNLAHVLLAHAITRIFPARRCAAISRLA